MKKFILFLITIAVVGFIGYKGKGLLNQRESEVQNTPLPMTEAITVRTITPQSGKLENSLTLLGQVMAQKSITLSTKLAGYIKEITVEESQRVKEGDILIRIDDTEIRSSITSLKSALATQTSDLALAKNIHQRNQALYEIGGLPKEKLELSALSLEAKQSTIEGTQQKIAQLEHQLSYLQIKAPFDGIVDTLLLHQGDLAATGKPIMRISTLEKKLLISYAPDIASTIKQGQAIRYQGKEIGKIKSFYTTSKNGLTAAEVALTTPIHAPLGSSITVEILTASYQGCMVPSDTLVHKIDGIYVMTYSENSFQAQKVTLDIEQRGSAIITPCPTQPIARASETILTSLPAYTHVKVIAEKSMGETNVH